jgi:hypothetical protein
MPWQKLKRFLIVAILESNRVSSPGLLKILPSVRPCTDTFGRKALAFLAVEHFQPVKKRDLIGVRPALRERISGRLIQVE